MRVLVVDIGCADHGHESSTKRLIDRFQPALYLGFDPHPSCRPIEETRGTTKVTISNAAAWVRNGHVGLYEQGGSTRVEDNPDLPQVPCVDVLELLQGNEGAVLKIDAEGAEYTILPHLILEGLDRNLELVWVEWHPPYDGKREIEEMLNCPLEEWIW